VIRLVAALIASVVLVGTTGCAGSDPDDAARAGSGPTSTDATTPEPDPTTTTTTATTTVADDAPAESVEELLARDAETLSAAAATGEFCAAYGAYDLLASRADGAEPADAVAIFEVGFDATADITPLVPEELEDAWSTFVFGAGLISATAERSGALPADDPELFAALERLGYWEAGDEVTSWYLDRCG
jgi:hypothetical protein